MESNSSDSETEEKPNIHFEALDIEENPLQLGIANLTPDVLNIQSQNLESVAINQMMPIITNTMSTSQTMTGMPNMLIPTIQNPNTTTAAPLLPIHVFNPGQLTSNTTNFYVIDPRANCAMPVMANPTSTTTQYSQDSIMQPTTVPTIINTDNIFTSTSSSFVATQTSVVSTPSTSAFSIQQPNVEILRDALNSTRKTPKIKKEINNWPQSQSSQLTELLNRQKETPKNLSAPLTPSMTSVTLNSQPDIPPPPKIPRMDSSVSPMIVTSMQEPIIINIPTQTMANHSAKSLAKRTLSDKDVMVIDLEDDEVALLDEDLLKERSTLQSAVKSVPPPKEDVQPKIVSVKSYGVKCLVPACPNRIGNPPPGVDFFKLPKDMKVQRIWLKTVNRPDLITYDKRNKYQICSDHFTKDVMFSKRIKALKPYAVPYISKSTCSDKSRKKEADIKAMNKINNLMKQLKKNLPKRDPVHSREFKYFALNLRIGDPIAYKFFKPLFKLPPERSLRDLQVFIPPLNDKMIGCVEAKLRGLPAEARLCALAISRIKLAKSLYYNITRDEIIGLEKLSGRHQVAEYAYVLMIRGLRVPWNQVVGYTMAADVLHAKLIIRQTIIQLTNVGVEVLAVITKENSSILTPPLTPAQPYYIVNDLKIYHIVDVPTLMTELYRILFKTPFTYKGVQVHFDHIIQAYAMMRNSPFKFVQKLTKRHVVPGPVDLASPAVATAVLARPVASAVLMGVFSKRLPTTTTSTANFINAVSDIYDLLNSSPSDSNTTPYTCSPAQDAALDNGITFFLDLREENQTGKEITNLQRLHKACLSFVTSLTSMKLMASELWARGVYRIWTRRFQMGPLDSAVASIHARCLHAPPTPVEFVRAFSKVYLRNLLDHSALVKHSIPHTELCDNVKNKYIPMHSGPIVLALGHEIDYHFKLPDEEPMKVVISYLVNKCLEQHACDLTARYFMVREDNGTGNNASRLSSDSKQSFVIPSSFKVYIDQLETCYYCSSVDTFGLTEVGLRLLKKMNEIEFACPCKCFPRTYLLKLFIRLRLYHTLKLNNSLTKAKNFIAHHLISMRQYDALRLTLPK